MIDQKFEAGKGEVSESADELNVLSALLKKLEQSENMTLDELDALIIQADTVYKSRLARLQRTRKMIDQLGLPTLPAAN